MNIDLDSIIANQAREYQQYIVAMKKTADRLTVALFDALLSNKGLQDVPVAFCDISAASTVRVVCTCAGDVPVYARGIDLEPDGSVNIDKAVNISSITTSTIRKNADGWLDSSETNPWVHRIVVDLITEYLDAAVKISTLMNSPIKIIELPTLQIEQKGYVREFYIYGHVGTKFVMPSAPDGRESPLDSVKAICNGGVSVAP